MYLAPPVLIWKRMPLFSPKLVEAGAVVSGMMKSVVNDVSEENTRRVNIKDLTTQADRRMRVEIKRRSMRRDDVP